MAWIITITKNLCLGRLRQHKKNADMPEEDWLIYVENHEEASPEDKQQLDYLHRFFENGVPDDALLADCGEKLV